MKGPIFFLSDEHVSCYANPYLKLPEKDKNGNDLPTVDILSTDSSEVVAQKTSESLDRYFSKNKQ